MPITNLQINVICQKVKEVMYPAGLTSSGLLGLYYNASEVVLLRKTIREVGYYLGSHQDVAKRAMANQLIIDAGFLNECTQSSKSLVASASRLGLESIYSTSLSRLSLFNKLDQTLFQECRDGYTQGVTHSRAAHAEPIVLLEASSIPSSADVSHSSVATSTDALDAEIIRPDDSAHDRSAESIAAVATQTSEQDETQIMAAADMALAELETSVAALAEKRSEVQKRPRTEHLEQRLEAAEAVQATLQQQLQTVAALAESQTQVIEALEQAPKNSVSIREIETQTSQLEAPVDDAVDEVIGVRVKDKLDRLAADLKSMGQMEQAVVGQRPKSVKATSLDQSQQKLIDQLAEQKALNQALNAKLSTVHSSALARLNPETKKEIEAVKADNAVLIRENTDVHRKVKAVQQKLDQTIAVHAKEEKRMESGVQEAVAYSRELETSVENLKALTVAQNAKITKLTTSLRSKGSKKTDTPVVTPSSNLADVRQVAIGRLEAEKAQVVEHSEDLQLELKTQKILVSALREQIVQLTALNGKIEVDHQAKTASAGRDLEQRNVELVAAQAQNTQLHAAVDALNEQLGVREQALNEAKTKNGRLHGVIREHEVQATDHAAEMVLLHQEYKAVIDRKKVDKSALEKTLKDSNAGRDALKARLIVQDTEMLQLRGEYKSAVDAIADLRGQMTQLSQKNAELSQSVGAKEGQLSEAGVALLARDGVIKNEIEHLENFQRDSKKAFPGLRILGIVVAVLGNVITLAAAGISYLWQSRQRRQNAAAAKQKILDDLTEIGNLVRSNDEVPLRTSGNFWGFCTSFGDARYLPVYDDAQRSEIEKAVIAAKDDQLKLIKK